MVQAFLEIHLLPLHLEGLFHLMALYPQVVHLGHSCRVVPFLPFLQVHKMDILHLSVPCLQVCPLILIFLVVHLILWVLFLLTDQVVQVFLLMHLLVHLYLLGILFLPSGQVDH